MHRSQQKSESEPNGQEVRSRETRAKMIEAAIELFATVGYEAASTRALAEQAGVNQAAIPYHFGGKRELYLAAAQTLAEHARERIAPIVAQLRQAHQTDPRSVVEEALRRVFRLFASGSESLAWVTFVIRSQYEALEGFRIIHEELAPLERELKRVIGEATGETDQQRLGMKLTVALAPIFSFRPLQQFNLSVLGWDKPAPHLLDKFETVIVEAALRELFTELPQAVDLARGRRGPGEKTLADRASPSTKGRRSCPIKA
ncbi:CerR family C-terminal domain-containing protein [Rhodopseudomonas palustris]|uniref:Transcriptional regulator, TetR family n=1 Tax=Rhodopseudomonas palustris (strain BisB18) TaxID=316056 RepID=Q211C7_RHOPB